MQTDESSTPGVLGSNEGLGPAVANARPLSDELMDCVDRLGHEADAVDVRVWDHLLVYAPQYKAALREIELLRVALLDCARQAERLKKPCGVDPEGRQAVRNALYQNISTRAHIALGTIRGPNATLCGSRSESEPAKGSWSV